MSILGKDGSARSSLARHRTRWGLVVLALAAAGAWWWSGHRKTEAEAEYLTARVERGVIRKSVAATGTVQAVLTVQVGSQVTGRIASLHADFNSVVKQGQILARIDPANFDAQLARARADLNDAMAGVKTAQAAVSMQKASHEAASVAALDAQRAFKRATELSEEGINAPRDLEMAQAANDEAAARLRQGEAQVATAEAELEQARARVDQARATVTIAEVNLFYTVIKSPVDGVVISRSVDVGQTVSASLQAPTIFTIANDLTRMQVVANVDEADIGMISADSRASFTVDAFPGETFKGALNQIRLNPQTQQNVVTYSVIVDVSNTELKLRPGMTSNTTFTIAERADSLRLPNAALRFWPESVPRENESALIAAAHGESAGDGPDRGSREPQGKGPAASDGLPGSTESAGASGSPSASDTGRSGRGRGERPGGAGQGGGEGWPRRSGASDGHPAGEPAAAAAPQLYPAAGEIIRFPAGRPSLIRPRVVWVLSPTEEPEARVVTIGISDGTASEVVEGDLHEGDVVIIGRNVTAESATQQNRSPFGMGAPMRPGPRR